MKGWNAYLVRKPEEVKIDCRKRNIIYEHVCELCNPEKRSTKRKKGKDLEYTRDKPSIYVGESSRSLAERALEPWNDHSNQMEESHMLKQKKVLHSLGSKLLSSVGQL